MRAGMPALGVRARNPGMGAPMSWRSPNLAGLRKVLLDDIILYRLVTVALLRERAKLRNIT